MAKVASGSGLFGKSNLFLKYVDHLYGGTSRFDVKLISIVTESSRTYEEITREDCWETN